MQAQLSPCAAEVAPSPACKRRLPAVPQRVRAAGNSRSAAAAVLQHTRLARQSLVWDCEVGALGARQGKCSAAAVETAPASTVPAEPVEAAEPAEPASSSNSASTDGTDAPMPQQQNGQIQAAPSDSASQHNLPFNVGDNVVGTVVKAGRTGAHVKVANYKGLLG